MECCWRAGVSVWVKWERRKCIYRSGLAGAAESWPPGAVGRCRKLRVNGEEGGLVNGGVSLLPAELALALLVLLPLHCM